MILLSEQLLKKKAKKRRITFQFTLCGWQEWKGGGARRHFIWLCTLSASLLTQRESHFFLFFDPSIPPPRRECEARERVHVCVRSVFDFRLLTVINTHLSRAGLEVWITQRGKPTPRCWLQCLGYSWGRPAEMSSERRLLSLPCSAVMLYGVMYMHSVYFNWGNYYVFNQLHWNWIKMNRLFSQIYAWHYQISVTARTINHTFPA